MSDAEEKPSEALQESRLRQALLANAFAQVFGQGTRRSQAQTLVLGHLAVCAGDDGNSYRFGDAKDGLALVAAGIHRDGARSILRVIERQVELAAKVAKPSLEKPKTKR
jgi:hypothetical protein